MLYLIKNPNGVAAIHCKAGKGRTGVMICCYLIFSGLCKNADEAMEHYATKRTLNKKVKIYCLIECDNRKSKKIYKLFRSISKI